MRLNAIMKRRNDEQGFTLVELIVVMAILALLAGLAVPKFGDILTSSKNKAHNANVSLIEQAAELYLASGGTDQAVTALTEGDTNNFLVANNYLKESPKNPLTDTYNYTVTINGGDITVTPARVEE